LARLDYFRHDADFGGRTSERVAEATVWKTPREA